mmetsp:Transcript_9298/g.18759  ORF Transcript_9298/g.18759 Transcript_9298/m.18759 type:complete len:207 (+) Transcript_9298:2972-3592(+)
MALISITRSCCERVRLILPSSRICYLPKSTKIVLMQIRMMMSPKNNIILRTCHRFSRRYCRKWSRVTNSRKLWSQLQIKVKVQLQIKVIHGRTLQNKLQMRQLNFLHMKPLELYSQSVLRNQKTKYRKSRSRIQQVSHHLRKKPWGHCLQNVLAKSKNQWNQFRTNLPKHLHTKPWRHYLQNVLPSQKITQRLYLGKILNMPNTSK